MKQLWLHGQKVGTQVVAQIFSMHHKGWENTTNCHCPSCLRILETSVGCVIGNKICSFMTMGTLFSRSHWSIKEGNVPERFVIGQLINHVWEPPSCTAQLCALGQGEGRYCEAWIGKGPSVSTVSWLYRWLSLEQFLLSLYLNYFKL